MKKLHLTKEIQPLSAFRANTDLFPEQRETLTDIAESEKEIEKKEYLTNAKAKERIMKNFMKLG